MDATSFRLRLSPENLCFSESHLFLLHDFMPLLALETYLQARYSYRFVRLLNLPSATSCLPVLWTLSARLRAIRANLGFCASSFSRDLSSEDFLLISMQFYQSPRQFPSQRSCSAFLTLPLVFKPSLDLVSGSLTVFERCVRPFLFSI